MKQMQYALHDIKNIAQDLSNAFKDTGIVTFSGDLGAGKTTLIRELVAAMGSKDIVTSPTFTYFNVYHLPGRKVVYHFDLYRLKNVTEFEKAGFFEYLYQPDSIVFIEWPEIIEPVLTGGICKILLKVVGNDERSLTYRCY